MAIQKSAKDTEALQSWFKYCLGGDVVILKLMGLYSMGSIFTHTEPKWMYWEATPFIFGLGIIAGGSLGNICNVFHQAKIDSMVAIEVAPAALSATLTTYKVH